MSAPFVAKAVQFSGSMPGGHGSAQFSVPVANAFLAPHHTLKEGAWITIYDDAHELYEGEIFSVKPSVDSGGQHKFDVVCGGLISVAGKRADVSATWVHRGAEGWQVAPGAKTSGDYGLNETVRLAVRSGSSEDCSAANGMAAVWFLDAGYNLDDDLISRVEWVASWDVSASGGTTWTWSLWGGLGWYSRTLWGVATETSSVGSSVAGAYTFDVAEWPVYLYLTLSSSAPVTPSSDRFVELETVSAFARGRTTRPRVDEAMVDLAVRQGLATSYLSEPVGAMLDDLHVGNGAQKVTNAAGLSTCAQLHAQPFEWGFWDNRVFRVNPQPHKPVNDAKVIVVGGGNPGLESWDVTELDEGVPDYACVLFGNKDDADKPESFPRHVYRPKDPPDDADVVVETIDFSSLILSDASAAAAGDNIVGVSSADMPDGEIIDIDPAFAKLGNWPGNNTDPTSAYREFCQSLDGALSGFAYTAASGWSGSNSPSDSSCLTGDGTNDYVSFGDVAVCDFGIQPFSVRTWLKLIALPVTGTAAVAASKLDGARGWSVEVTPTGKLRGYVGGAGAVRPPIEVTTTGTVTVTTDGSYTVLKFTGSGSLTVTPAETLDAEVLVVAGGGGGSQGAGGAGGYLAGNETLVGTMPVTVGTGGAGKGISVSNGDNGLNSVFGSLTAIGGGGGVAYQNGGTGVTGGSGGGASSSQAPGAGTAGQGYNGSAQAAGGGGGASAPGSLGTGGAGINNDIVLAGTNVMYATGGSRVTPAVNGAANTGDGGSGYATGTGGNGGSGIVVVRYLTPVATAAANCLQKTASTATSLDDWHHVVMTYAGSGGDIVLYVDGDAAGVTSAGAAGAHDLSNAGNLQLFKGAAAVYMNGSIGRTTAWGRVLSAAEVLTDYGMGQGSYARSRAAGTVVIKGTCKNRQGAPVPAHHVRAGWWIQNLETGSGDPLYITGHSVDLGDKKNALTIGIDWMEKEIGVRQAELLAIPATVVPDAAQAAEADPYQPDAGYEPDAGGYDDNPYTDPGEGEPEGPGHEGVPDKSEGYARIPGNPNADPYVPPRPGSGAVVPGTGNRYPGDPGY